MSPIIFAIDPGPVESGWAMVDDSHVMSSGVASNAMLLEKFKTIWMPPRGMRLAIEMIASYGMPVGREVFETCVWIGRFVQAWHVPDAVELVYRKDVKMYLCGTPRAKDANVRQAIIDRYPAIGGGKCPQIGVKAKPGPLFGLSTHAWPALGVALTVGATA